MTLTSEHLKRRVWQGLDVKQERPTVTTHFTATLPDISVPLLPARQDYTSTDRLKGILIERVLPVLNLTSYNNLKRAREREEQNASRLMQIEQHLARYQREIEILSEKYEELKASQQTNEALLALVEDVSAALRNPAMRAACRDLLVKHFSEDGDANLANLLSLYQQADESRVPYWDIRTAVRVLSRLLKPQTYLEIGTRRGWSMAQLLDESPQTRCFSFDAWVENYANAQGSPESVMAKMQQITGQDVSLTFVPGNSHDTLPLFFRKLLDVAPPASFDMITVDGDHSLIGAWQDLYDVFPHVRVGGAILFDDLEFGGEPPMFGSKFRREPMPDSVNSLRDVWHQFAARYPNFVFIDCFDLRFQAGVAIRIR